MSVRSSDSGGVRLNQLGEDQLIRELLRGVSTKAFDGRGNYTLGLHDQLIFPEIDYAKVDKLKGMNVTIVTTARTDDQARALLRHLGMPFRA